MSRRERRHQLLDATAQLVVDEGLSAMSMERIAERAGVSKALPYAHFDNVEAALVSLYQREWRAVGAEIVEALEHADPADDLLPVRVRAYFDAVARRAEVLSALSSPGTTIPKKADPDGEATRYTAGLLYRYHGVSKERALAIGGILQGTLSAAVHAWIDGRAERALLEETLVAVFRAAIDPGCVTEPVGGRP